MGDPAGIGPEIVVRSCIELNRQWVDALELLIVGRTSVIQRAVEMLGVADTWRSLSPSISIHDVGDRAADDVKPGEVSAAGGRVAYEALKLATLWAVENDVDAVVTAPLNKAALHAAGIMVPGHTELLAQFCHVSEVGMMLHLPPSNARSEQHFPLGEIGLSVVHVTLHTALRNVFDQLTTAAVVEKIKLIENFCSTLLKAKQTARKKPRIAVAALNPHGGEDGLFGKEEIEIIRPAVEQGLQLGFDVTGPEPCDTLMRRAALGEFDAVVAMYHDQGHIALKLLDMFATVNITLGLPIIRTSVAHGTANEIAWTGQADCESLNQAILVAHQLASAP